MRVSRALQNLGGVVLLALALSGCVTLPPPVAAVDAPLAARADLDQRAYGGAVPSAQAAVPQASVNPAAYASDPPYRLDAGDRLRIVVFGQEGLTNSYAVDAGGAVTMPLIGAVHARGL
ncbi:MAG: polysaccharide biosynthesis/export family protein, partial [Xanthobacteraceae bacterium]